MSDSDVVIVSQNRFWNGDDGHIPAGTVWVGGEDIDQQPVDGHSQEEMLGEPAIDWRGLDAPAKRGRPRKGS